MKTVALYARISTNEKKQNIESQIEELRRYASVQNWQIAIEYRDEASGAAADRPALEQMCQDAVTRKFDTVLIFDLSRLTRNGPASAFQIIERLKASGVDLWSYREEYFRTAGPVGSMLIAIAAFIAEAERQAIRDRVSAGIAHARSKGKRLGRPPVIVDRQKLLELRKQNLSIRTIAEKMEISRTAVCNALNKAQ